MQAEIQTKVKISVSEIKKIIAEKFCLYHDFEVEIVEDSVAESETAKDENNEWIDVPKDWKFYWCPIDIDPDTKIDVIQRNGKESHDLCSGLLDSLWSQDDYSADIVKYRLPK